MQTPPGIHIVFFRGDREVRGTREAEGDGGEFERRAGVVERARGGVSDVESVCRAGHERGSKGARAQDVGDEKRNGGSVGTCAVIGTRGYSRCEERVGVDCPG